jgi:hypothetical protein
MVDREHGLPICIFVDELSSKQSEKEVINFRIYRASNENVVPFLYNHRLIVNFFVELNIGDFFFTLNMRYPKNKHSLISSNTKKTPFSLSFTFLRLCDYSFKRINAPFDGFILNALSKW